MRVSINLARRPCRRVDVFHLEPGCLLGVCPTAKSAQNKSDVITTPTLTLIGCGLETIKEYKGKPSCELPSEASLPDELNAFSTHFEASNTEAGMSAPAVPDDCEITLSRSTFTRLQGQMDY